MLQQIITRASWEHNVYCTKPLISLSCKIRKIIRVTQHLCILSYLVRYSLNTICKPLWSGDQYLVKRPLLTF